MSEHKFYLTFGPTNDLKPEHKGKLIAICSRGQPQLGDKNVEVLSVELVSTPQEAREWYDRVIVEQPWIERT